MSKKLNYTRDFFLIPQKQVIQKEQDMIQGNFLSGV